MARISHVEDIPGTKLDDHQVSDIWAKVEKFAQYGFNKSHAAAYAVLAFQTAYLKRHHPYAFFAASMDLDIHKAEKIAEFVREMRHEGLKLETPDVNRSHATFTVAHDRENRPLAVRYALGAIRGVGVNAMQALVAERARGGHFQDLPDLIDRMTGTLNRKALEGLVDAGACDRFGHNRTAMRAAIPDLLKVAQSESKRKQSQQVSFFDVGMSAPVRGEVTPIEAEPQRDILTREYDVLGLYLSGHPLDGMHPILKASGAHTIAEILSPDYRKRETKTGALITDMEVRQTRDGRLMATMMLSDPTGLYETVAFPEDYQRMRQSLDKGKAYIFTLGVGERDGMRQLFLRNIEPLNLQLAKTG